MFGMKQILSGALLAATAAQAHMQLSWPYPYHSIFNPAETNIDYSMTSPLTGAGGIYPCKGYINNPPMGPVATYAPGGKYNFTLAGTANHNGGSCQLSLSYDQGETFQVFQSFVGGCPLISNGLDFDFSIPSDAPAGEALFAWTWVNHSGNREFYMNCAVVTIGSGSNNQKRDSSGLDKSKYPSLFVANAGVNECATIEGIDVVYPNPGPNVVYGGDYASSKPTTPAGFTGSNCVAPGGSSDATSPGASTTQASNGASPSSTAAASMGATTAPTATSSSGSSGSRPKTCKSKRNNRSDRTLYRRGTGRVAALPATHPKRESDAQPAARAESEPFFLQKRGTGRVAAMPATHPGASAHRRRANGRVAALPASHGH